MIIKVLNKLPERCVHLIKVCIFIFKRTKSGRGKVVDTSFLILKVLSNTPSPFQGQPHPFPSVGMKDYCKNNK